MKLPIQRVPNTTPPQFVYYQTVNNPGGGKQLIRHIGAVSSSMETALCNLLDIVQRLVAENAKLKAVKK